MKALRYAIEYLHERGKNVPSDVLAFAYSPALKQGAYYRAVRNTLWASVYDAVYDFLSRPIARTGPETRMRIALAEAWQEASNLAYQDGGGSFPIDDDTQAFINSDLGAQLAYSEALFQRLLDLRREGDANQIQEAFRRADGYTNSLDILYNNVKAAGAGNKMLTFAGSDGEESCKDCQKYKGQRHRASWWLRHDAVPPNRDFECHGYRCQHILIDDNGMEFTA